MEEEGRNILLLPEPDLASSPTSSAFTATSGIAPSPTLGFESAQSDTDGPGSAGDSNSFHTASYEDDSATEREEEELTVVNLEETTPSTAQGGKRTAGRPVYDLPPGFESQPKLALKEESIRPIREKAPLPDDSIVERLSKVQGSSYEPTRRRPSIDIPNETTPLMTQNSFTSDISTNNNSDNSCCIIF